MKINNRLDFLISLYIFCIVTAEVAGGKIFPLLNTSFIKLNASVAIFLMPLVYSINDVITEVFGAERTRGIIRSGIIILILLSLFLLLTTSLPPSTRFMKSEAAYDLIFKQTVRITVASLIAFGIADFLDVVIFVNLRKKWGNKALWLRNNASNFISEFLDTTIFMTLAFYELNQPIKENITFLIGLILPYWLLKCFMSVIETPLVYLGVTWLKGEKKQ